MRWTSWLPRSRQHRISVVGLDVGSDVCSLVVLTGSQSRPDSVCCAERLSLPAGWVAHGEVLQPFALGQWLRKYLEAGDYQPEAIYIGLDDACISHHIVTLTAGLSEDDVAFQLLAEIQSVLPVNSADVCIDYLLETEQAQAVERRYLVQAVPRGLVEALQGVAVAAGLDALVVEPRSDAACRSERFDTLGTLPTATATASAALALQCAEAFGLALRAWCAGRINFLPHRQRKQHLLRRAWWMRVVVCAAGGAILGAGFAVVISLTAETTYPPMDDLAASARAYDDAQKTLAQAKAKQQRSEEQARWLHARKDLQAQSLQWSRVLSQAAQGVWVASVKQQGTRWTVHGEALSARHAQQLAQQLKALDIWTQLPELPELQVMPAASATGLPVWQFRIEADLKVGV